MESVANLKPGPDPGLWRGLAIALPAGALMWAVTLWLLFWR